MKPGILFEWILNHVGAMGVILTSLFEKWASTRLFVYWVNLPKLLVSQDHLHLADVDLNYLLMSLYLFESNGKEDRSWMILKILNSEDSSNRIVV